ncbi:hypothetical protein VPH35_058748 [Triticum aestivum]
MPAGSSEAETAQEKNLPPTHFLSNDHPAPALARPAPPSPRATPSNLAASARPPSIPSRYPAAGPLLLQPPVVVLKVYVAAAPPVRLAGPRLVAAPPLLLAVLNSPPPPC